MADKDFGFTLWGKDWLRLAESLRQTHPDPQLPRARRLARDGGVEVTVDAGTVRAVMRRGRTVSVANIEVEPMARETMAEISRRLSGARPALTDELYRAITEAGHPPVPSLVGVDCTCGADTQRCLHALAAYYAMARRIDDDPRIALDVQGFFRAPSDSGDRSGATASQRWIALRALDPADYFTVPEPCRSANSAGYPIGVVTREGPLLGRVAAALPDGPSAPVPGAVQGRPRASLRAAAAPSILRGNTTRETSTRGTVRAERTAGSWKGSVAPRGEDTPECGEEMPCRPAPVTGPE
ncbi:hypothetical protein [Streptacidiphilus sp. P02-A3a]|uniref:hypothetical protein n=1 Tax=Streptacidiphilus sp. P02-A3a TaxID=2704468 RepID=UPI001CDC81A5|nr:hypothetical protein [Streptacidiphilus sp. P02-A3a]